MSLSDIDSKTDVVEQLAEASATGLYALEDAETLLQPFGEDAVEKARDWSATFFEQGAMPHGDNDDDDEAVGVYEVAQIAIEAEGGESLSGEGAGRGFHARDAYRKNMWRLSGMIDGVSREELGLEEPSSMEG